MSEPLNRFLQSAREAWGRLTARQRTWLIASTAALAVAGGALASYLSQDPRELLFSDLQTEEANAVVKKLGELGVPHTLSNDHANIYVPKSRLEDARINLAKEGLPGGDVVGFEKFDGSTFGMSSYVQRIQYVRAVQGELIRSIQRLSSVKRARVHISLPPKKTFLEEEDPPKASVVLELRHGQAPTKSEVQGVAHLVASAVEGLKVNQVTIVDTNGKFLLRPEDGAANTLASNLLEMQHNLETDYERRIEDILGPVVGIGRVKAKVSIEVDPSRSNVTEETFDPDKAAIRNNVKNEEVTQGTRLAAGGIPGSRSNLPGGEAKQNQPPALTSSTEKNNQNVSYAVPRKIQVTDRPSGSIKRLTVAVLVDGQYTPGAEGTPAVFTPRPDAELKRLQEIVGNSVGFDPQRRDSITVTSMPFEKPPGLLGVPNAGETAKPVAWYLNRDEWMPIAVKGGLISLFFLLLHLMVIRPMKKWSVAMKPKTKPEEAIPAPKTIAQLEEERLEAEGLALPKVEISELPPSPEKIEEEDLRAAILEKLEAAPKKGIRIVQDWMEEKVASHAPLVPENNA